MNTTWKPYFNGSCTVTTWTVRDEGRPFAARYPGTCAISGQPFSAGSQIRMATVDGEKKAISQQGLRDMDVRGGDMPSSWCSSWVLGTDGLEEAINDPATTQITVRSHSGGTTQYKRSGEQWHAGYSRCTAKQMVARTRSIFAWSGCKLPG